ncbi:ThuA domain-containing protein [Telmatocola sphagniphila]|uniref:ThuA domain-containing protein n=1 Tax=Telmatocola sphagniphila TaxID=1123043 RepID=A0A8E6EYS0_9BACT|nr:PVC-type heme-binding CxxCH protein [Telmatocola sphagniphila]QVL32651.1 ThuA domain-containing protein [Telmatocola sphagniphila]
MIKRLLSCLCIAALAIGFSGQAAPPKKLTLLFLGDNGHHQPAERYRTLAPVLEKMGIELVYTDSVDSLNEKTLSRYDAIMIYANQEKISKEQESALINYVENGKALICLHCGSYCFLNSPKYIELVGAQFQRHGTGILKTEIALPDHPIMKGFQPFESWDETYVHHKHNEKNRTVLEYHPEGSGKEPWTWTRTQGKGRVFYTAWGHDDRTWSNEGFQQLVARGVYWAVGLDPATLPKADAKPKITELPNDLKPFEYVPAKVAFYPPGKKAGEKREPLNKMQKPLSPEESVKHVVHPDDFDIKLFVSEEKLGGKPICMNWDEQGRLWVALTYDYPNELQPKGQGRDKIVICEDTTGKGVADKITVFADKLSIPTSLIFHRGGVIVHQAPDTLFLKDNTGSGHADERRVLFTGWHTNDTHAGPSNLHYGLDNWIYGMVGYSGFNGTIGSENFRFGQGFYRYKPDTNQFEFLRSTNNNSWGIGLSEEGVLFGSTANGNPSVYMPIANRYYERVLGWSSSVLSGIAGNAPIHPITENVRQVDWHGGHTAAAGHALYTARNYPSYYWDKVAFVTEPTGHVISTFQISPKGSDYVSKNSWNLIASNDEWTAPIMAEVGPDGSVWYIDWYNFIVQHNPTPVGWTTGKGGAYETDLRDKKLGRIYRVVPKNAKSEVAFTLKGATPEKLVETLRNSNMFWRNHAQRLLVERGQKDVVPQLMALLKSPKPDEIGIDAGSMHALWTLEGLNALDTAETQQAVFAALTSPAAGVRRAAVQLLPRTEAGLNKLLESNVLEDSDAQVRLAALLTLSEMPPSAAAGKALVQFLENPLNSGDRWLRDASTAAAATHAPHFVTALFDAAAKQPLNFSPTEILGIVTEHMARSGKGSSVLDALSSLESKIDEKTWPKVSELVNSYLQAAIKGWTKKGRVTLSEVQVKSLKQLYQKVNFQTKGQLLQVAQLCESTIFDKESAEITEAGFKIAGDEKAPDNQRVAAVRQLVQLTRSDAKSIEKLLGLITPRTPPVVSQAVVESVLQNSSEATGTVLKMFNSWSPNLKGAALREIIARKNLTLDLLTAMEKQQISISELSLDQKQNLANNADRRIAERAKKLLASGGGIPNADRQKVIDEWMFTTKKAGDSKIGKQMFTKHCAICHRINGEGNMVGPDLTGMSVHPKEELIVHILDPSRSVEGNYRMYTVKTAAGTVLNGLLASETKTSVELIDAQAKKQTILREDIEEITTSNKSLMPEGFEKQMNADEFANLLEFLTEKGKFVPLPLDRVATACSIKGMFFDDAGMAERLTFSDWKPKTFNGVPFVLVDPTDGKRNIVLLNSPNGLKTPNMPKSVSLACNTAARSIHILGGISGWGYPYGAKGSTSMIVRLHYKDGKVEDHPLKNGEEMADYIRVVDVPNSKLAFKVPSQQIRYLSVTPKSNAVIENIELVKGRDETAPIVVAVTVETP